MAVQQVIQYAHVTSCSGVLFEVPTQQIVAGDTVELRLWGGTRDLLLPYTLYKGTDTMGSGEIYETTLPQATVIIDFAETYNHQFEWPYLTIDEVLAINEIQYEDEDGDIATWAHKGELITPRFARNGYSCIYAMDRIALYGSISAKVTRSPVYKRWYWTVPAGSEGLHWFFIYKGNDLTNKFSIELPDLTATDQELRNITLTIRDKDTDALLPGTQVFIDGLSAGVTDAYGQLPVTDIVQGTHTLKLISSGYLDSDDDNLNNDSFEVY